MLQFGMPTLIEIDSLEVTMQLCEELGLDFVELNMNLPQYQAERLEDVGYLRQLQEKYGIGYTIHLDENLNVCDFNKAVAKAYMDTVVRAIRTAKALEVPILNMHMNHGVHFTLPDKTVQLFEQYFEEYMKTWKEFREVCERTVDGADLKICIENTDGYRRYERSAVEYLLQSDVFCLTQISGIPMRREMQTNRLFWNIRINCAIFIYMTVLANRIIGYWEAVK